MRTLKFCTSYCEPVTQGKVAVIYPQVLHSLVKEVEVKKKKMKHCHTPDVVSYAPLS